ncbi:MAG: protein phosphatase 2C domain-containing protein, partial [Lachnospiraceae bacterium]|nr:protein phosphatase 2C domain-containing protein [Lachnospiraceae bacterium]
MRKQNSDFEARFISEEGSQLKNRDYFGYVELDEFACYVIADGITEATDVEGARLAIETVILSFQENPSLSKHAIKRLLKQANRALLGKESDRRLKASITVVVTDYQKMRYGYVGNTRLRMYRGGAVYRQTKDMSLAWEMAEQEKIAKDELMQHEERNNLYAYLGQKKLRPMISKKIKLAETDMIALYTRGIWENVDEAELDDVFADADNVVQKTVDDIEDLLLSRQPENLDNYTLAVIFINKVYRNPERRKRIKKIVMITIVVVILILAVCAVLWFLHYKKAQRTEDMNYHFTNTVEYVNTGNYVRAKEECAQAQELAEKLRDSSMRNRLQEYSLVIETVLLADESYISKDYDTAEEYYLSALDRTRYADNIGTDYMENKLNKIGVFLSVEDYLALGDTLLEQGDYEGSEEKYLLAKKAALSMHDAEGKQNAMDALEKLYAEEAEAKSEMQEEADSQAQEAVAAAQMVAA